MLCTLRHNQTLTDTFPNLVFMMLFVYMQQTSGTGLFILRSCDILIACRWIPVINYPFIFLNVAVEREPYSLSILQNPAVSRDTSGTILCLLIGCNRLLHDYKLHLQPRGWSRSSSVPCVNGPGARVGVQTDRTYTALTSPEAHIHIHKCTHISTHDSRYRSCDRCANPSKLMVESLSQTREHLLGSFKDWDATLDFQN